MALILLDVFALILIFLTSGVQYFIYFLLFYIVELLKRLNKPVKKIPFKGDRIKSRIMWVFCWILVAAVWVLIPVMYQFNLFIFIATYLCFSILYPVFDILSTIIIIKSFGKESLIDETTDKKEKEQ